MGGCAVKKSVLTLPLTLTVLVSLWWLLTVFLRTLAPGLILPQLDIPTVVLLCLLALLAEAWFSPQAEHNYVVLALVGAMLFGLLPFAASVLSWQQNILSGVVGLVMLPALTAVFVSIRHRLASGPHAPLASLACALCLYLAMQAFRGVLL